MNKLFLNLPQDTQRNILLAAAPQLGILPNILEKDIWLCWILQQLFLLPEKISPFAPFLKLATEPTI